jgi:hypothetical protein
VLFIFAGKVSRLQSGIGRWATCFALLKVAGHAPGLLVRRLLGRLPRQVILEGMLGGDVVGKGEGRMSSWVATCQVRGSVRLGAVAKE